MCSPPPLLTLHQRLHLQTRHLSNYSSLLMTLPWLVSSPDLFHHRLVQECVCPPQGQSATHCLVCHLPSIEDLHDSWERKDHCWTLPPRTPAFPKTLLWKKGFRVWFPKSILSLSLSLEPSSEHHYISKMFPKTTTTAKCVIRCFFTEDLR